MCPHQMVAKHLCEMKSEETVGEEEERKKVVESKNYILQYTHARECMT